MTDTSRPPLLDGVALEDLLEQAIASHHAWKFDEAERCYRAVLAHEPGHADGNHNLGVLLAIQLLRPAEAPGQSQYWFSYIDALIRAGQQSLAASLLPVAQSMGVQAVMINALNERLRAAPPEAQAISSPPATQLAPPPVQKPPKVRRGREVPESAQVEMVQLFRQRDWQGGEVRARALTHEYPDSGFAWKSLGVMLHTQGKLEEALTAKRKSAQLLPMDPEVHCNLGHLLQEVGQFQAGLDALNHALKLKPQYPEAYNNLGITYQRLGDIDRSLAYFKQALALQPENRTDFSNYLFTLNYHPDLSAEAIYDGYTEFERRFGQPVRGLWQPHDNPPLGQRRLRVAYVSPDFRAHATSNFLAPLLAHHDKSVVEIFAYATLAREDEVTQRYKACVDHWLVVNEMSDAALAERIRADGIDILVDLAGHTTGNRLGMFARKPAPVSVSWMGYGYTTGLKAIDYFLANEHLVPQEFDHLFSETPWRMEGYPGSYRPRDNLGEVNPLPALERGYITFGTLTRAIRINHRVIRVWSELLKRVPGSRLVIDSGSYKDEGVKASLLQKFEAQGISRDRLEVGFHSPPWDVLRGMDISLDCFPHNSGTTLVESLYLGVPYITLADRPSVGRLGSTVLHSVGHPEWIAYNEEEYLDKAVALASDLPALAQIRARLREEFKRSEIMDEVGFVRRLERTYQRMFQQWEASRP